MGRGSLNSRLGDPNCASHSDLSISGGSPRSDMGPLSGILTGLHITCLRAARFLQGEKREDCNGCLTCLRSSCHHMSQLPAPGCLLIGFHLPPGPQPAPSFCSGWNAFSSAHSMRRPSSPSSTWKSPPYCTCVPCCRGPQSPLSAQHLHLLMVPAPQPL